MSVHIAFKGNVGNHLFQYAIARLFAEKNQFRLVTPFTHPKMVKMADPMRGRQLDNSAYTRILTDEDDILGGTWGKGRYIFDGYFQRWQWYAQHRARILEFARPVPAIDPLPPDDLVVSLRLGEDYRSKNWVIDSSWYTSILDKEWFRRLYLVTDHLDDQYLKTFGKYDPVIVHGDPLKDWDTIRAGQKVICPNSTFSWWACFLGYAQKVYTFKRWVPVEQVDLGPFPVGGVEVEGLYRHEVTQC